MRHEMICELICNRNGTRIYNKMTGMKMKQEIDGENGGGGGGIEKTGGQRK